jgi:hypothetical protein
MGKEYTLQGRAAPGYKTWAPKAGQLPGQAERACPTACPGGGTPDAAGLSKPHIRTGGAYQKPKPSITWYPGASLVEIHVPRERPQQHEKDSQPRGKITEWSAASRGRLKRLLATIEREELARALVVTLTYPAEFPAPDDHAVYKGHLHILLIYLRRKWPTCSGVWKLEFQSRGAAHYHLMLLGLGNVELEAVRAWMRETWYRIAHKGDKHKGVAGTQVDPIRSIGGATSYFEKYMGKGDQTIPGNFSGRYWGKHNEKHLATVEPETEELDERTANQLRRIARKKVQKDVENSRWKRFLKAENEQYWRVGGRLFWETLKSAKHGSKPKIDRHGELKIPRILWMYQDKQAIEMDGVKYVPLDPWRRHPFSVDLIRKDLRKLPRRWKSRNNDRVRMMGNASLFVAAIKRLDQPASSFLEWSKTLTKFHLDKT